ncbi:class I SAM-dependent methyltransferase [Leifsonia flava]|uniref:Class I SAM-dependent methyltransferase n=1 Tax=Orlajensenia leifsoniae TaxID=2561933 RepID=A0A4Y9R502_9MICO|nr:class I SAM-dependent methyltransferase [Leifsonia flava]TFV99002.1 class I SAM-dependent methyltransferase [Leifsonia flava]
MVRDSHHAASFGENAGGYDAHRPSYPLETVRWLIGGGEGASGDAPGDLEVLDLGAGTGKLTERLVELAASVTAVDPSPEMLEVLGERMPHVRTLVGSAEAIPLPDDSVDLVTVAQAWHWVDPEAATREVLRVLRPDGRLALIWNTRDDTIPWVDALSAAMHRGLHEATAFHPTLGAGLELTAKREERWMSRTTRQGLLELATTRSYYLTASAEERSAMLERIESVLDSHPETRAPEILLPYVTEAWIAEPWVPGC